MSNFYLCSATRLPTGQKITTKVGESLLPVSKISTAQQMCLASQLPITIDDTFFYSPKIIIINDNYDFKRKLNNYTKIYELIEFRTNAMSYIDGISEYAVKSLVETDITLKKFCTQKGKIFETSKNEFEIFKSQMCHFTFGGYVVFEKDKDLLNDYINKMKKREISLNEIKTWSAEK